MAITSGDVRCGVETVIVVVAAHSSLVNVGGKCVMLAENNGLFSGLCSYEAI